MWQTVVMKELEPSIVSFPMEYYTAIEKDTFESALMRSMNPEPFIQSEEVRKRKTNMY